MKAGPNARAGTSKEKPEVPEPIRCWHSPGVVFPPQTTHLHSKYLQEGQVGEGVFPKGTGAGHTHPSYARASVKEQFKLRWTRRAPKVEGKSLEVVRNPVRKLVR